MELLTIFGKVVAKNRAFGNNIIFLQQFFHFGGGGVPYVPTYWCAYGMIIIFFILFHFWPFDRIPIILVVRISGYIFSKRVLNK